MAPVAGGSRDEQKYLYFITHGGQGESLVPHYTRGSVFLGILSRLYSRARRGMVAAHAPLHAESRSDMIYLWFIM